MMQVNHYITLCPQFYSLPSLSRALSFVAEEDLTFNPLNIRSYLLNRASVYFHESLV